jgi:hypothetical protein
MGLLTGFNITLPETEMLGQAARAAFSGAAIPDGWSVLTPQQLGVAPQYWDGIYFSNNGASAIVLQQGDAIVVSFRGTDSQEDFAYYPELLFGTYIDRFQPLLTAIAAQAPGDTHFYFTGASLGGGAVNQMADIASYQYAGRFAAAQFVAFASPIISNASGILNVGFENDPVYKVLENYSDEPSSLDNLVLATAQYMAGNYDGRHPLDYYAHSSSYLDVIGRLEGSAFYDFMSPDSVLIFDAYSGPVTDVTPGRESSGAFYLGEAVADQIIGRAGDDFIEGFGGDDTLSGTAGNDRLDGGTGVDSAVFSGLRSAYSLTDLGGGSVRVSGPDGTDTLSGIERLVFDDTTVIWPLVISISAAGDFNSNRMQDYIWRDGGAVMTMWQYDATAQQVTADDLGTVGFSWNILASDHFSNASTDQMLTQNVGDGDMTLWWVSNGQLTGVNIGQNWNGINYITNGQFTDNGGAGIANFLVTNVGDHHLYYWWIDSNYKLQGNDLGAYWSNISFIGTGEFTPHGGADFLVTNTVDHHLYDWWIDPTSHTLQGVDLGAAWSNIEFLSSGHFSNHTTNDQFLVRNTVDNHLYEWWITPQHTLSGIDLGAWPGIDLIDTGHFNDATTNDELLVRNSADGHFYEWWISNNQLAGADLGVPFIV